MSPWQQGGEGNEWESEASSLSQYKTPVLCTWKSVFGIEIAKSNFLSIAFLPAQVVLLNQTTLHLKRMRIRAPGQNLHLFYVFCIFRIKMMQVSYGSDGKTSIRRCGVTPYDIDVPFVTGKAQTIIELLHVLHREAFAEGKTDGQLAWCTVHGEDIADIHQCRLIA